MELRHFRYFVAVAEELSFSRAAKRLAVSQPPLSQQIRHLEEELGVTLLHRTKRVVELSQAGRVFLDEARATLAKFSHAADMARRASRGELGALQIGLQPSADLIVVPRVVRAFQDRYPGVSLSFSTMNDTEQALALAQQRIDVGFASESALRSFLTAECIYKEPLILALSTAHRLAHKRQIALAEIRQEPFVLMDRRIAPASHDFVVAACQCAGFTPNIVQESDHIQLTLSFVAMNRGVSLLPERAKNLPRRGLVYRKLMDDLPTWNMMLIRRRDNNSEVLAAFIENARKSIN